MKPKRSVSGLSTADNLISVLQNHGKVLAGNVSFGSGSNTDHSQNIAGCWATGITTPVTPNTEFSVPYRLGSGLAAQFYDVKSNNTAGVVYKSTTPWTATIAYFKCSVASATVSLFLH